MISKRAQRREEAEARASLRNGRSDQEQLAHLDKLGMRASKERARLVARISSGSSAKVTKPETAETDSQSKPKVKAKERRANSNHKKSRDN